MKIRFELSTVGTRGILIHIPMLVFHVRFYLNLFIFIVTSRLQMASIYHQYQLQVHFRAVIFAYVTCALECQIDVGLRLFDTLHLFSTLE